MNVLTEGEKVRGRDGSVGGTVGGRCAGGVNSGAFGDRVEKFDVAGTAVHGDGLEVSGKSHFHPCFRRKIGRDQYILSHFPLSFETHVESDGG